MYQLAIKFNPYSTINPQIYAYTTPGIPSHEGWTKIGYTEKQTVEERIKQQTHTADIKFNIEWHELAQYTDGNKRGDYFKDHDFHDYLERFHQVPRMEGKEWFQINGENSHKLFRKFVAQDYSGLQIEGEGTQYVLRKEQQEAVDKTVAYYNDCDLIVGGEFLWNAKPRFGKTLTAYDFMRRIEAKNVLIVTNRPSIANSWFDDFSTFISWQEPYYFVSETDALSERPVLSREEFFEAITPILAEDEDADVRQVCFESLQGLKGSVYFGGQYDKLKWILDTEWDLLIVDEAHEGVDTDKTDTAFRDIRRKFTLHLSGTPFKAIAMGKFGQKQIFNWSFSDEQEAKENWYKKSEGYNPYAVMPKMNLFTYQMSKIIQEQVNQGLDLKDGENVEYTFDLNEFFKTNESGKFVYEKDVKKFLDALTTQEKFPFSTSELRKELAHTFWLLERVDSVKAMAKLLKQHPVFEQYEIIVAAGDGRLDDESEDNQQSKRSYDKVREAIANKERTITLSVGQLTTGVTIPEWTAVFMLSNMRSSAEYIQAAFRAQNPYKFNKDGKYYQKENAYIFDFAPERTLLVYDDFANSLYSTTAGGGGTKEEREANIKRLINFFSVYAEDDEGKMVELDASQVLTVPIKIKTEEVIKHGFMNNFLFDNISNIFAAPKEVVRILKQIKPVEEQSCKQDALTMENIDEVPVGENGEVEIPQAVVVNQTAAIFGEKIYEVDVAETISSVETQFVTQPTSLLDEKPQPQYAIVEELVTRIADPFTTSLYGKAKEEYGLTVKQTERIANRQVEVINKALTNLADDFTKKQTIMEIEKVKEINNASTPEQVQTIVEAYKEKAEQAQQEFKETLEQRTKEVVQEVAESTVREMETKKEENKKRSIEGDIRARLRGFARTIPSFIMAYGDDNLKLSNFEDYPPDGVFKDVTSIDVDQFKFLRDGGDYLDEETGETKHFEGHLFDEVVFDESIKSFMEKKRALANYFDENHTEDIFDYIPPQETNQIFTPKRVVKMMVDQLEENEPDIFGYPDKTFVDFYMKSGLYITEIVKRLYRNPLMKSLYPDDNDRIKHILECQVFGFAPTRIIYDIAISYIFGFDENANNISRRNFFDIDTLPYAKEGKLQELVNEKLADRIK